jgi:AraC-like DNA-binding protein/quercetin dioxygenase-like cupin family protein
MAKPRQRPAVPIRFVTSALVTGTENYTFGKTTYLPNGSCGPRVQVYFQLVVLLQGSLRLKADGATHDLKPGDAILERPGQHEFFRFSSTGTSVHTWCEVKSGQFSAAERRLLRAASGVFQAPSTVHVLIEEGLAVRDHAVLGPSMEALARACVLRFAQHAQSLRQIPGEEPPHPAYTRARETATAAYAELRSAGELARRAGVSATQLRSLFRENGSESPSRMIWRLKVEHAIQLLRSTGLTLGEVAAQCGYANPFHLSRAVKKHTGYPPRGLRRQEWKRTPVVRTGSGKRKATSE